MAATYSSEGRKHENHQGPGVFPAQFSGDGALFNTLKGLAGWAADKGFRGVQIPTWDRRVFDLERAADSQDYVDEIKGTLGEHGLVVTDLASHLHGQLIAVHPPFNLPAGSFAPAKVHRDPKARQEWAVNQLLCAAKASRRFGLDRHTTFSGARGLLWSSQVAIGQSNGLRLRVFGEKGSLAWHQEQPNELVFTGLFGAPEMIKRGRDGLTDGARVRTRTPPGHPEGYVEAFTDLYSGFAAVIRGKESGKPGRSWKEYRLPMTGSEAWPLLTPSSAAMKSNGGWLPLLFA